IRAAQRLGVGDLPRCPSHGREAVGADCYGRQQHVRRPQTVVEDGVDSYDGGDLPRDRPTRVQVTIVAGEVAAGDVDPQSMAGLERLRRCPQIDLEAVDLARLYQDRALERLAVAGP